MKKIITKLQFRMASWLYNHGIIAPQLLSHNDGTPVKNIKILTPEKMKKYTFDIGDCELEVSSDSLNGAWNSVNQYDFATLTHINGVRVGYKLKEKN